MQTVVFCGFKGGTARTSTCLHLGAALAKYHKQRVLLVDFDAQANLSTGLGFGTDCFDTMVPVLQSEKEIDEVIAETSVEGVSLIPANTFLDQVEATAPIVTDPYAHERLRKCLAKVRDRFDFVFIDIPPSFGWLCQSAFFASNFSVICSIPEPYSILALRRLAKYHAVVNEHHEISVLGVLLSMWDSRSATNRAFLRGIEEEFPGKLFDSRIRRDVTVSRAILKGRPVFDTNPCSRAADDYCRFAEEFIERCSHQGARINTLASRRSHQSVLEES